MQQAWQAASVRHDELVGTAAADWPDSHRALLQRAGLDGDRWVVVALELSGSYRASRAAVLAVPMPAAGLFAGWEPLRSPDGTLAVHRFALPAADVHGTLDGGLGLLAELKRWSVRLVVEPLRDVPLVVLVEDA